MCMTNNSAEASESSIDLTPTEVSTRFMSNWRDRIVGGSVAIFGLASTSFESFSSVMYARIDNTELAIGHGISAGVLLIGTALVTKVAGSSSPNEQS